MTATAASGRPLRLLLLVVGLLAIAGSFFLPVEPTLHGGRTAGGWMVAMAGACVLLLLGGELLRLPLLGYQCAVFALGTMCQLGLTQPHWLQHLVRPWELGQGWNRWFVAGLLFQATTVLVRARRELRELPRVLLELMSPVKWLVAAVVFVACSVHATYFLPEGRVSGWLFQLAATAALFAINFLHLVHIGRALTPFAATSLAVGARFFVSVPGDARAAAPLDRKLPWLCAGFVLLLCVQLAWLVFERIPHIPDEVSYLFMAKCFAQGRLSVPAPPAPEAFQVYLLEIQNGQWFSTPPFGWPAVLALGELLGVAWLVNPLIAAATIPVAHALVRRLADRGTANLVALVLTCSPWFLFLGASFMTHPLSLLLLTGALLQIVRGGENPGRVFSAGVLLGALFLVRPLEGLVAGSVTGLWCLGLWGRRLPWPSLLLFGIGILAAAGLALPYNAHFSGDPFQFPINAYTDRLWSPGANSLGFGAGKGAPGGWNLDPFPGHGLRDVLYNTNQNLYCLNFEFLGWAVGSLLLPMVHLLLGRWNAPDRFFLLLIASMLCCYNLYWYSGGPEFGARYWYLMILPCAWLVARGARTLTERLHARWPRGQVGARIGTVMVVGMVVALGVFVPWRAVTRYRDFRGFHAGYRELAQRERMGRSLVLVKTNDQSLYDTDFASAVVLNDPAFGGDAPVFARDLGGAAEAALRAAFPTRPVWRIESKTIAGGRPRVVERPAGR